MTRTTCPHCHDECILGSLGTAADLDAWLAQHECRPIAAPSPPPNPLLSAARDAGVYAGEYPGGVCCATEAGAVALCREMRRRGVRVVRMSAVVTLAP